MDTKVCFVLLLAIGLSAQKSIHSVHRSIRSVSEFQIDFNNLVNQNAVRLPDGKGTLLNCIENCDKVKETACKCVHFDHCMKSTVFNCISTGLDRFNFPRSEETNEFLERLSVKIPGLLTTPADPEQWQKPVSPRVFLNYILEQHQKSNAQMG